MSTTVDNLPFVNYGCHMYEVQQTEEFKTWMHGLRDKRANQRIATRVYRLQAGLLGDVKFFDGIGELRIDYGPGYRVYFVRRGSVVVLLLCGGDKSTQQRDIAHAKTLAKET